jgi:hypothetical protein
MNYILENISYGQVINYKKKGYLDPKNLDTLSFDWAWKLKQVLSYYQHLKLLLARLLRLV